MPNGVPQITIRPALPADLPAIGRLGAVLVQTHHDFDSARFIPATPATPRDTATGLFAWCLSLGVVSALLIAAYVHQAEVVAFWPPAARAYALLGLK